MFLVSSSSSNDETCEAATQTTQEEKGTNIDNIVDINRYNTLAKLLRVTAFVLRFVNNIVGRQTKQQPNVSKVVSTSELHTAEQLWVRHVQQECFDKELTALDTGKTKHTPIVRQLKLFQDENHVLRCGGRLQNVDIAFNAKHPVLLPSKHPFTKLVVQRAHMQMMHSGLESTAAHIRQSYWIPRIRQVVKSTLRSCVTCSRVAGMPYRIPVTPPLPDFRLETSTPLTSCGVDFTGALFYKGGLNNDKKAYVCLFTCAVTRAIHLELVTDLSCDTFLRAFRRFAARRSLPRHMISDNGTTFVAAAKELKTLFSDPAVHNYLSNRNVDWSFIPKRAPWFGGFYERLIGVTKQTLKKTLGRALLTLDELNTVLTEVESVINDRPITYLSAEENLEPLTPLHFLCGHRLTSIPVSENLADELQDPDYGQTNLHKRAKRMDCVIQQCWQRWKYEYLPALRESHSHNKDAKSPGLRENLVKVGDVVLVHSDTEKRINWPLGVITELSTGKDGLVRSCTVRTKHGITTRPIKKLYPLEMNIAPADGEPDPPADDLPEDPLADDPPEDPPADDPPEDPPADDPPEDPPTRPRRAAALQSRQKMRGWIKQLRDSDV